MDKSRNNDKYRLLNILSLVSIFFIVTVSILKTESNTTICQYCNDGSLIESIYEITENTATCTSNGTATFTCKYCNRSFKDKTEPIAHDWGIIADSSSCLQSGIKVSRCRICKERKSEISEKTKDHLFDETDYKLSDDYLYKYIKCKLCKQYITKQLSLSEQHHYKIVDMKTTLEMDGFIIFHNGNIFDKCVEGAKAYIKSNCSDEFMDSACVVYTEDSKIFYIEGFTFNNASFSIRILYKDKEWKVLFGYYNDNLI